MSVDHGGRRIIKKKIKEARNAFERLDPACDRVVLDAQQARDRQRTDRVLDVESASELEVFFFFKQKTAYEVFTDWSSDVCSSDLSARSIAQLLPRHATYTHIEERSTKDPPARSEERRVGKECRSRWSQDH